MSRFVEELKRRSVIKVALAYLVAAWVLLQVADLLVPILSLPDWTNRLVFLLLVIGFVPALIISWAYELTPEGVVRDEADTTDSGMPTPKTGLYLTAMVSVAIVAAAGWWFMGADERWVRNEALPQLEALAEQGEYEAAYQLSLSGSKSCHQTMPRWRSCGRSSPISYRSPPSHPGPPSIVGHIRIRMRFGKSWAGRRS